MAGTITYDKSFVREIARRRVFIFVVAFLVLGAVGIIREESDMFLHALDDYDICTHNSGHKIWWRGSNTSFAQDNAVIAWTLYAGTVSTGLRFLQVRCGIY